MALGIRTYVVAGGEDPPVPTGCRVPLPEPGPHRRRARVPTLAKQMAARLGADLPPTTSIQLGTALGSQTETIAFVENMVANQEQAPKPRAFSTSVHNAAAAQVAIALDARGENQTWVQGALSFLHALFGAEGLQARGDPGPVLVGALDEVSHYVERGRSACLPAERRPAREAGALFLCELTPTPEAVVRFSGLAFARPADERAWLREQLEESPVDLLLVPQPLADVEGARSYADWTGDTPAAPALAAAVAVTLLGGETPPSVLGRTAAPARCAVVARSRFGDVGLVRLERA